MSRHNINTAEARPHLVEFINEYVSDWNSFPKEIDWTEDDQEEEILLSWADYWEIIGSDEGDIQRPDNWTGVLPCDRKATANSAPAPEQRVDELFEWAADMGLIAPGASESSRIHRDA